MRKGSELGAFPRMRTRRFLMALYAVLLLLAAFPATAYASGASTYHPPAITVVSYNAPEDLEIQVEMVKNGERFPVSTVREQRAWELSFRLYREGIFRSNTFWGNEKDFAGSVLLCQSGGEERRVPIPQEYLTPGGNKDVMTLDCESWTLRPGLPFWRGPASMAERMLLILAVKALLFLLMDYKQLGSWLSFLGVNLATQFFLNYSFYNMMWVDDLNLYSAIFIGLLVVLLAEILLLVLLVQENNKNRTAVYATAANLLGVGAFLAALSWLPV